MPRISALSTIAFFVFSVGNPALAAPETTSARKTPGTKTVNASYYGKGFHGKKTADGSTFDKNANTAASKTLPLGSKVAVTNKETGKQTEVVINDRGPNVKDRQLDLSEKVAKDIGLDKQGTGPVEIKVLQEGKRP